MAWITHAIFEERSYMTSPRDPSRLSKSRFLSGLQCHKRLYLEIHAPQLADEIDDRRQMMLEMGKEINEIAHRYFPGGALVAEGHRQSTAALEKTAALMADPAVPAIFEGAFQFEGTLVRVDVLERVADSWKLIEVKAASRVKSVHLDDLAVQTHVLRGNGLKLSGISLMHVNRQYVYPGGDVNLQQLFVVEDLTEAIQEKLPDIPPRLDEMRAMLGQSHSPVVEPDHHCHSPYECPFWSHCTASKPARWIYYLPGRKDLVRRLRRQGIETIDEIPTQVSLPHLQQRVRENVEWISPKLAEKLQSIRYPVHHLDFETVMPAVPLYAHTHPYQPIPIQWSNHTEAEDGTLRHTAHLSTERKDPRESIAVSLLESVGDEGSICVYSEYEHYIVKALAEALPHLREDLLRVGERLWDLLEVLQTYYYHPDFQGSFSIKSVLPALVPSLDYGDLEIKDGATASAMYHRMMFVVTDWVERQRLESALLAYCARDTLGMVELRRVLSQKVQSAAAP